MLPLTAISFIASAYCIQKACSIDKRQAMQHSDSAQRANLLANNLLNNGRYQFRFMQQGHSAVQQQNEQQNQQYNAREQAQPHRPLHTQIEQLRLQSQQRHTAFQQTLPEPLRQQFSAVRPQRTATPVQPQENSQGSPEARQYLASLLKRCQLSGASNTAQMRDAINDVRNELIGQDADKRYITLLNNIESQLITENQPRRAESRALELLQ